MCAARKDFGRNFSEMRRDLAMTLLASDNFASKISKNWLRETLALLLASKHLTTSTNFEKSTVVKSTE